MSSLDANGRDFPGVSVASGVSRAGDAGGAGGPRGVRERGEPLWRDVVGEVLRAERLAQGRTLRDVADKARMSMPYLSEIERGRKEASSEVLAAAARALGLRLSDVLRLAHGELVRLDLVSRSVTSSAVGSRRDGLQASRRREAMCLAA